MFMRRPGKLVDSVATRSAHAVTRRRLLRNSGGMAMGAALTTAYLGQAKPESALAIGTPTSPCGPSPFCPSSVCNDSAGCACYGRVYNTYSCNQGGGSGCWFEDYRPRGGHLWKCCDCCCSGASGSACSGCSTHRACICRRCWAPNC